MSDASVPTPGADEPSGAAEKQAPESAQAAEQAEQASPAAASPLDVKLDQYAGPLDLLLDLIRKHKLSIYDIPIAQITKQYLDYVRRAEELNINLGGEFVFMAATLIQIKSKMLLPKDPIVPEAEQEDPRQELVQQLMEHEKFVQAAQMLRQKRVVEENVWSNPPIEAFIDGDEEPGLAVSIFDLVQTFQTVLDRARNRPTFEVAGEDVSVSSRVEYLRNLMRSTDEPVILREVFERQKSRRGLIATFLAVLEMVRMQAIMLRQRKLFGEIVIRKHKMFDVVFSKDDPLVTAEGEYLE